MSLETFEQLTPKAFGYIVKAFNEEKMSNLKLLELAIYSGNGQLYSKTEFKSAFEQKKSSTEILNESKEEYEKLKKLGVIK
jgi:hypothetical protein